MEVKEMTVTTFWKGESRVRGVVEEDGKPYGVNLYVKGSRVNDYSCSCGKGSSYRGMCGHGRLLLQHFQDQASGEGTKSVSTSQEVRTMIREYTNREVARIISREEEGRIRLVPRVILSKNQMRAEFKVGRERLYVVRDLVAFAKAVETGGMVEYGKNLSFRHSPGAFSPESRALAEFVVELVNLYEEHYRQFQKSSFFVAPSLRELNLSRGNRDRFFALVEGEKVELSDYWGEKRVVLVENRNPDLKIRVERSGKDGFSISVPAGLMSFSGENSLYIVGQEGLWRCDREFTDLLSVFMEQMVQVYGASRQILVNEKDMPLFYERVLRKMESCGLLESGQLDLESYRPQELKARFDFDSAGESQLSMVPTLAYGDYSFHPTEDEKVPRTVCRDVPKEFAVGQIITKYFQYRDGEGPKLVIREDEDAMYRLLTVGLPEFMDLGEVYLSESFKKLRVLPPPRVSVGIRTLGNWLELSVDAGGMSGQELAHILAGYRQKKKYFRLKNGSFLRLEDQGFLTVARLMDGLGVSGKDLEQPTIRVPGYRALYIDGLLKESGDITLYRDQLFKAVVRGLKSVEDSDFEVPKPLLHILRGYQKIGYRWMRTLDAYGFGGILADDMGLGKTIQVIALLLGEASGVQRKASLIVCPASLVYNWENELHTFAPSLSVLAVTGSASERCRKIAEIGVYDVAVTSYDLLKRDISLYQDLDFRFQIIDEAQFIKNAGTQSAKAVKIIRARTKFALTGTPVENRLGELWSIFDYLMPGFLFTYSKFREKYEGPIVRDSGGEALGGLHRLTGPFVLRRLKSDVLKELPEKLENLFYSAFEKEQKDLYTANAAVLKEMLKGGGGGKEKLLVLAELTRLRQICCDPRLCYSNYRGHSAKLETCVDLLRNGVESGHKILLFSQFTSMLDLIGERLRKEEIRYYLLTGATSKEERLSMVNAFHSGDVPVFLISLKAGGTGLNLTAADMVIHYDPWWNVAAQNQATDRTHRIGQKKQVTVFKLITKNTIEENILKLQEAKQSLADQVITEGAVSLGSLDRDELLRLLE